MNEAGGQEAAQMANKRTLVEEGQDSEQDKLREPAAAEKLLLDDEEEDDNAAFEDYASLSPTRLPSAPEKAERPAKEVKDDAVKDSEQRSDRDEADLDSEMKAPPKLLMKEKKKSKGIRQGQGLANIEERGRTIECMGEGDGHDGKSEPDQYDLKIREIEEKIRKRKEEQESKKKKSQLFEMLMDQQALTKEEQEERAREQ